MSYAQLTRFMLPLVVTALVQELSGQFLNGGMARMPRAVETLAAFGLAFGLALFFAGTLSQVRQLGLVLVENAQGYRVCARFVLAAGLLLAGILASLALTPLGTWIINDLHGVDPALGDAVRLALLWLVPYPVLQGMTRLYSGALIRVRRTDIPAYATTTGIALSILAVFALLPLGFVRQTPIALPVLAVYTGALAELGVVAWGRWRLVRWPAGANAPALTYLYVLRFFWPLALIMAVQAGTRPLINMFVARSADGTQALAVLTIVYALGHIPYGWLNELRNLPTAFRQEGDLGKIRRFCWGCCLFSCAWIGVLFWTPAVHYILGAWIGIGPELIADCKTPLLLFTGFPFVVSLRSYFHGIGLLQHRTQAMAPSAPSRVATVLLMLALLANFELHGATQAVGALLSGHTVEALVVWWSIGRGRRAS